MVRAVRNALALSFVAEVLALLTGRLPWPSLLVVLASASYLIEAVDTWREERTPAARPAPALDAATSVSLAATGTRGLTVLPRPRGHGDDGEAGEAGEEVPDGSAPAEDEDKLLQRA